MTAIMIESFISIPNESPFSIYNLPFGIFSDKENVKKRVGVAIGAFVLDLENLAAGNVFASVGGIDKHIIDTFSEPTLNSYMALSRDVWKSTRLKIQNLLLKNCSVLRDNKILRERVLIPLNAVTMHLPARIGDYTDFYASLEHATNVGTLFRGPENALMPNWLHLPVGYHGRASSIVVSGHPVRRPYGQSRLDQKAPVCFGPSKRLDFELELALFVGGEENPLGNPVDISMARERAFGVVLMNDWSARDIQAWEYVPLGPFQGKSFATTISPWVVTMDALEPFAVAGPAQDPRPLSYLLDPVPTANYDINLQVIIKPNGSENSHVICRTNSKYLYWSMIQQLTHHAANGCNLRPGDLLGTGTISGKEKSSLGSMLELSSAGKEPVDVGSGQIRNFLQDGDLVTMTGFCESNGIRIGFGNCTGLILPAIEGHHHTQ